MGVFVCVCVVCETVLRQSGTFSVQHSQSGKCPQRKPCHSDLSSFLNQVLCNDPV